MVNPSVPVRRPPISIVQIIAIQVILVILAGMLLDGGGIAGFLGFSVVLSWVCCGVVAIWKRPIAPRVLLWIWLSAAILLAAIGGMGGSCMNRNLAQRSNLGSNERQIVLGCIAYSYDDPRKVWPPDMPTLIRWSDGDISDKQLRVRWHPELARPIIYIRPVPTAPADQPVMVSDPACDKQGKTVLCYADGHVGSVGKGEAQAVWDEACRLADLPRVRAEGARPEDWTVPAARDR